jgi:hypothetical protein
MSNQSQQKPSQNPNQSSSQGSSKDATKSWDKDSSAKSQNQTGMKEQSSQPRDQFRSDASKK